MEAILEKAALLLTRYPLCDACLGRQFALLGHGLSNAERGRALKIALLLVAHRLANSGDERGHELLRALATNGFFEPAELLLQKLGAEAQRRAGKCYLCEGVMAKLDELAERALEALSDHEFSTFLVGVELPPFIEEREDELRAELGLEHGEGLRSELSREIGKRISALTGVQADFEKPDIVIIVEPFSGSVRLQVNPVFVAGRYRKLVRGIPQAKWICTRCQGRGCPRCGWTGKMYPTSVSELITEPMIEAFVAEGAAFHAAGREDVDARVLGSGRPFVVELKRPKKRNIDLRSLEEEINKRAEGLISVSGLRYADRRLVRRIKGEAEKVYELVVEFERDISDEELRALEEAFSGATIRQRTPKRVLHRRPDKLRLRKVHELRVIERLSPRSVRLRVRCDGGLYVKELVTGDDGRTAPSISELIKVGAKPLELDVVDVLMEGV